MLFNVLSRKAHGVLDHAVSLLMPIAARAAGAGPGLQRFQDAAALVTAGYSAVTDYPLAAVRMLPMRAHLALDAAGGAVMLSAAAMARRQPRAARMVLAGTGLVYLAAALCTRVPSRKGVMQRPGGLAPGETPMSHFARETRPQAAEKSGGTMLNGRIDAPAAAIAAIFGGAEREPAAVHH